MIVQSSSKKALKRMKQSGEMCKGIRKTAERKKEEGKKVLRKRRFTRVSRWEADE